jgi:oxidoreductase
MAINVLVVGSGWVASTVHLPRIERDENLTLVGIVEAMPARRRRVAETYDVDGYADLASVGSADVDVALICTPPDTHVALALACLDRGWHVICEKPLAVSIEECETLLAKARTAGRSLRGCYTSRYREDVGALRRLVASGELGQVRHLRLTWRRARGVPSTRGGLEAGAVWDIGAHLLDAA